MLTLWEEVIGTRLETVHMSQSAFFELALACLEHAFQVNLQLFESRVSPEYVDTVRSIITTELRMGVTSQGVDLEKVSHAIQAIFPIADSDEELVPGWSAFVNALASLKNHLKRADNQGAISAMYFSYQSVADRAAAIHFGTEYNCGFDSNQRDIEKQNALCSAELHFQLGEADRINGRYDAR